MKEIEKNNPNILFNSKFLLKSREIIDYDNELGNDLINSVIEILSLKPDYLLIIGSILKTKKIKPNDIDYLFISDKFVKMDYVKRILYLKSVFKYNRYKTLIDIIPLTKFELYHRDKFEKVNYLEVEKKNGLLDLLDGKF